MAEYSQYINKERLKKLFIRMAEIDTGSCETSKKDEKTSTKKQMQFAKKLANYLRYIGLQNVKLENKTGIVTAELKGNIDSDLSIGLIAHMDTSEQAPTGPVKVLTHDYTGGNIQLKDDTIILEKVLEPYKNDLIITSDGTTLLGADDKAGIAEIIEAVTILKEHKDIKHPNIKLAFTPDEEIGYGVSFFNIKTFGADLAYTVDGSNACNIESETFNAFNPEITFEGIPVHSGYAYNKMINSIDAAALFLSRLPKEEKPEKTQDREGFYHVYNISGDVSKTTVKMIVRDFDYEKAKQRIKYLQECLEKIGEEFNGIKITFNKIEAYKNMKAYLEEFPEVIEYARHAIARTGLVPQEPPVRGGTDGAMLTVRGLLTPNLGTGGVNFHSKEEFVSLNSMALCTENILNLMKIWADNIDEIMAKIIERRKKLKAK